METAVPALRWAAQGREAGWMNLHDLAKRRDRDFIVEVGTVAPLEQKRVGGAVRCIVFDGPARLRIRAAHLFSSLWQRPQFPGWSVSGDGEFGVWMQARVGDPRLLWGSGLDGFARAIALDWRPTDAAEFDLVLEARGSGAIVDVGRVFDVRGKLVEALCGRGLEVGPGANPAVVDGTSRTVTYLEASSSERWDANYAKASGIPKERWSSYIRGDAHSLDCIDDQSLDFIFSNHVFEHLVNPLGVLRTWWKKLRPGGVIASVVPDCRYSFDARQPPSTMVDVMEQTSLKSFSPTPGMYERWCRHTQPANTPEDLRRRQYSIHVNFYTPEVIVDLLRSFADTCALERSMVLSTSNGRDIGFHVVKGAP